VGAQGPQFYASSAGAPPVQIKVMVSEESGVFLLYKKTGGLRDRAKVAVLATFVDRDWRLRCPLCGFAAKKG
jgi:hypothetical protein